MRRSVKHTIDFDRILALPRRSLDDYDGEALADAVTEELRRPSANDNARIRPEQAIAIVEALESRGAWIVMPVGGGKTLVSMAIAVLTDAKRPLLIAPASLREKTAVDFAALDRDWRTVPIHFASPNELALAKNQDLLDIYRPDVIVIDESDDQGNMGASVAKRIDRYILDNPDTIVILLTATPSRKSIMSYWHLVCWALRERAPLPMSETEAQGWANAIDEQVRDESRRARPGPLGANIHFARAWYRDRLESTPGVVIFDGDSCDQPLRISLRYARDDRELEDAYEQFLTKLETPSGEDVSDPLSKWNLDNRLGCGFYLRFNPAPPDDWRIALRTKNRFVRQMIERREGRHGKPCDTEAQVLARYKSAPAVTEWRAIKDTFKPNTEAVWINDSAAMSVLEWLAESDAPSIVWVGSPHFGERLSQLSGLPFFGSQGEDASGLSLARPPIGRSIIASWPANKRGFNLQAWARALIVHPPQSAKYLEQTIGRHHRSGLDQPMCVTFLITSGATLTGLARAIQEARFVQATLGSTLKLLRAEYDIPAPPCESYRWGAMSIYSELAAEVADVRRVAA